MVFIKQYIKKKRRTIKGLLYSRKYKTSVKHSDWWDEKFYKNNISSDASTISKYTPEIVSDYHYNSIELILLSFFHNNNVQVKGRKILDIGSGSGYWINFYNKYQPINIVGMDISKTSCDYLRNRFKKEKHIKIEEGNALDLLHSRNEKFFCVNAIGIMFHIVDDNEWKSTIKEIYNVLEDEGLFIVGGHFGLFNKLNIQIDNEGNVNKRLRSSREWKKVLKEIGFKEVIIKRNNSYLKIDWLTPEANILIGIK